MSQQRILLFFAGVLFLASGAVMITDSNSALFVQWNQLASKLPDIIWANLTFTADTLFVMALLGAIAARRTMLFAPSLLLLLLGTLCVHGGKFAFDAARPAAVLAQDSFQIIGPTLKNHSFPSGHSFTIFAALSVIILTSNRVWLIPLLVWALLGAFSRIAVGAHWPLDALVGSGAGILVACLTLSLHRRYSALQSRGWSITSAVLLTIAAAYLPFFDSRYPDTEAISIILSLAALSLLMHNYWKPFFVQKT